MAGAAEHDDKINVRERTDRSIRHVYGVRVDHCRTLMLKKVETARMVPPVLSCPVHGMRAQGLCGDSRIRMRKSLPSAYFVDCETPGTTR